MKGYYSFHESVTTNISISGIGELNDSVTELSGNSEDHAAKIKKIESSIESSSSLIQGMVKLTHLA